MFANTNVVRFFVPKRPLDVSYPRHAVAAVLAAVGGILFFSGAIAGTAANTAVSGIPASATPKTTAANAVTEPGSVSVLGMGLISGAGALGAVRGRRRRRA